MTKRFKKGETVRCVEPDRVGGLHESSIHEIMNTDDTGSPDEQILYLVNLPKKGFYARRFVRHTGKLLGYKLLKNLPDVVAGSLISPTGRDKYPWGYVDPSGEELCSFTTTTMQQQDWFEPVYEPVHAIIETVNGKQLEVNKKLKQVILKETDGYNKEYLAFAQVKRIASRVEDMLKPMNSAVKSYTPSFIHFRYQYGCVEVNLDNIRALVEAMKD